MWRMWLPVAPLARGVVDLSALTDLEKEADASPPWWYPEGACAHSSLIIEVLRNEEERIHHKEGA